MSSEVECDYSAVPVQIDSDGVVTYDAMLYLASRFRLNVQQARRYLLSGDVPAFIQTCNQSGLEVDDQDDMLLVHQANDQDWYATIQLAADAALYKKNNDPARGQVGFLVSPTFQNSDGTYDFDAWKVLKYQYNIPVDELETAIIQLNGARALELAQTQHTNGRWIEANSDEEEIFDEFVIEITNKSEERFVAVQLRVEALLMRRVKATGRTVRRTI